MSQAGETNAQQLKRYRADATARGLCYVCRCRFPRPGVKTCDECLERVRKRKATAKVRKSERPRRRAQTARRLARLKAAGLCIACGRVPPIDGYASCSVCLDKIAARVTATARRRGVVESPNPCSVCGRLGHQAPRHRRPGVIP